MSTNLAPSPSASPVAHKLSRVLLAALKLGAMYAIGVTAIFLFIILLLNAGAIPLLGILSRIWIPVAVLTLLAFVTLAIARGIGFLLLWGLTLAAWVLLLTGPASFNPMPSAFLLWSMLTMPLAAIVALGQPSSVPVTRNAKLVRRSITLVWLTLFALAMVSEMAFGEYVSVGPLPHWLSSLLHPLWFLTPFVIGVNGVTRALALFRAHRTPAA